jgi:flagellar biosynthesis protein FlhF
MSTLTFQQFVRDRLSRKRTVSAAPEAPIGAAPPEMPPAVDPATPVVRPQRAQPAPADVPLAGATGPAAPDPARDVRQPVRSALPGVPERVARTSVPAPVDSRADAGARARSPEPARMPTLDEVLRDGPDHSAPGVNVMAELREMRGLIASQLSSLAWFDGVRRNPLQVRLLRRLIGCGFSSELSRKLLARLPDDFSEADAERWLHQTLGRLLRCDAPGDTLADRGGIYALMGPTGVGKTTTAAKIAAQFALRHGVQSVGLLTVDAYRIGAQDQLRTFGRLLGVPVHVAHDAGTLAEFLHLFMNKKLVLIDTVGVGQRDERLVELLASLSSSTIRRLVVLNAASQAETIEDVITAYRAESAAGVVISKVDEAVKTGGVIDCVLRHRLRVVGVADGQRVPEDWHLPDAASLVERALRPPSSAPFAFDDNELALLIAAGMDPEAGRPAQRAGKRHV